MNNAVQSTMLTNWHGYRVNNKNVIVVSLYIVQKTELYRVRRCMRVILVKIPYMYGCRVFWNKRHLMWREGGKWVLKCWQLQSVTVSQCYEDLDLSQCAQNEYKLCDLERTMVIGPISRCQMKVIKESMRLRSLILLGALDRRSWKEL